MTAAQLEFIGRSAEVDLLTSLLDRSKAAEFTLAFVEGEAGIGKTRLMLELAGRVRAMNGMVLLGSSPPPAGQPLPFAAVTQCLRDALRQLSETEREAIVSETPELGHLLPAWRLSGASPPSGTSMTVICEQFLSVTDRLARERPVVAVFLDDLQWADSGTLDLIAYMARSLREGRVLIALAARIEELSSAAPLRRLRAELVRGGGAAVPLGPLDGEEAARYVETLAGSALTEHRRERITGLGQGNPFFLQELVNLGDIEGGLPDSVRDLVRTRLASLDDAQRDLLRVIATAVQPVSTDLLLGVSERAPEATIEGLRHLLEGGLLRERDDETVSVAHPLVREVVAAEVLDAERRRIHAALARALTAEPDLDPGTDAERLVRLANHWLAAGDRIRTFPALARAAEASERTYAFGTAFELYRKALDHIGPHGDTSDRRLGFQSPTVDSALSDLRRRAAEAAILTGEPDVAIEWIDDALRDAAAPRVRDQLELTRARCLSASGDVVAAVEAFTGLVASIASTQVPVSARIGLARALIAAGRAREAVPVAEAALAAARAARSSTEEEAALLALGTALAHAGELESGVRRWHEARSLRSAALTQSALRPRASRVMDLTAGLADAARAAYGAGLGEDAAELTSDALAVATQWGAEGEMARLRIAQAEASIDRGEWGEALRILNAAADSPGPRVDALALRARVAAWRGSWERAAADLAACEGPALVRSRPEDRAAFSLALAELRVWRRQLVEAADATTEGLLLARDAPAVNKLELLALAVRVHVDSTLAARALRSNPESMASEEMARALVADTDRHVRGEAGPRIAALVETARAELGRLGKEGAEAWAGTGQAWQAASGVWWTGYASFREAEAWLVAGTTRGAARDALIRASSIARALEAAPLAAEIEALAVRARIDIREEPQPAPRSETTRKLPISDRELEVLALIARGRTNREIASELFISERTAAHHVSHIFDKLGVSSRVEAAGVAHQSGVLSEGSKPA
jgi:DNA-binding CsgD family transcriptional regulator/tetratricopeptide (TPR) repeat protein